MSPWRPPQLAPPHESLEALVPNYLLDAQLQYHIYIYVIDTLKELRYFSPSHTGNVTPLVGAITCTEGTQSLLSSVLSYYLFIILFFCNRFSGGPGKPQTHLLLTSTFLILPPPPAKCWFYRWAPPWLVLCSTGKLSKHSAS